MTELCINPSSTFFSFYTTAQSSEWLRPGRLSQSSKSCWRQTNTLHRQAWHENTAKEQCLAFPRSLRRANGDYTSYRGIIYIKGAEESLSSAFREKVVRARLGEEPTRSLLPRRYVQPASDNVTLSLEIRVQTG